MVIASIVDGRGLRQGDLLEFLDEFERPYNCRAAMVMTADCDLVQSKHYGHLLLCPILPAQKYLDDIWILRRIAKFVEKQYEQGGERLNAALSGSTGEQVARPYLEMILSCEEALRACLQSAGIAEEASVKELTQVVEALDYITKEENHSLQGLARAESLRYNKNVSKTREALITSFRDEASRDSLDVVVLPDELIPDSLAHVVVLRSPFSVPITYVGEALSVDRPLRRVGAYEPQVKFLIAQKFGFLFSRIGMPGPIEKERLACITCLEINE